VTKYSVDVEIISQQTVAIEAENKDAVDKFCRESLYEYIVNNWNLFNDAPVIRIYSEIESGRKKSAADVTLDADGSRVDVPEKR
jgi:hypothetical protein